jgi:hypothetical protein
MKKAWFSKAFAPKFSAADDQDRRERVVARPRIISHDADAALWRGAGIWRKAQIQ